MNKKRRNKNRQTTTNRKLPPTAPISKVKRKTSRRVVNVAIEDWSRPFNVRLLKGKVKGQTVHFLDKIGAYDHFFAWYLDCAVKFYCMPKATVWAIPSLEMACLSYCQTLFLKHCSEIKATYSEHYEYWLKHFGFPSDSLKDLYDTHAEGDEQVIKAIASFDRAVHGMSVNARGACVRQARENADSQIYVFTDVCESQGIEIPTLCA